MKPMPTRSVMANVDQHEFDLLAGQRCWRCRHSGSPGVGRGCPQLLKSDGTAGTQPKGVSISRRIRRRLLIR